MPILLSVVIPTFRRPALLERAIHSVLQLDLPGEVEVVVVPNGPDHSWEGLASALARDPRVHWHYQAQGNACAARNLGLRMAKGRYVRFLDDDDTLLPATAGQVADLVATDADLASGPLLLVDEDSGSTQLAALPATEDYPCCALLAIAGCFLAAGTVYRRTLIADLRWREDVSLYDDYLWSLAIAQIPGLRWRRFETPVGCYLQHAGDRLSRLRRSRRNTRHAVDAICALQEQLAPLPGPAQARTQAAASALLTLAHSAFPASPVYLSQVIQRARQLAPQALPRQALLASHPAMVRHLLLLEWLALPLRVLSRSTGRVVWRLRALSAGMRRR